MGQIDGPEDTVEYFCEAVDTIPAPPPDGCELDLDFDEVWTDDISIYEHLETRREMLPPSGEK
jgi:hypothetical protein